jgi:hypothetical protein
LFFHKQQQKVLGSQVKALTKEKKEKEKENVLIDLEWMNMKKTSLLQSKEFRKKIIMTLVLGSRLRQRHGKVRAESGTWE